VRWSRAAPVLETFDRAVRVADPEAAVVLGGCGYDALSSPADGPARRFFERVLAASAEHSVQRPDPVQLPELDGVLLQTMAAAFSGEGGGGFSTGELAASTEHDTPERRALKALYAAMPTLPAALQMFMVGCPPELDALRDRINCREIISRNLFALAHGVGRTVCWQLAPEVGNYLDTDQAPRRVRVRG
jgi:hypothetical protein